MTNERSVLTYENRHGKNEDKGKGIFTVYSVDKRIKITIVDDEKDLVGVIKDFLEERGLSVSTAFNGREGVEVIKRERPDLIVLDIIMPGMDGRDVLVELKKDLQTKDIPVIILTVKSEQLDRTYGLELGAYEYLAKPYDGYRLLRQINRILDKKRDPS